MRLKEGRIAPLRKKNGKWRTACTSPSGGIIRSSTKIGDGDMSPASPAAGAGNKGKYSHASGFNIRSSITSSNFQSNVASDG